MRSTRRSFLQKSSALAVAALVSREGASLTFSGSGLAHDPQRPACHLLAPHNWMNDPNGPIWWKGKYHLFYQLNPQAATWGNMHWGHAVSTDMVHWQHRPIALAPTPGGADSEGCFSGSAVVFNGVPTIIYTGVQNAPQDQVTLRDGSDKLRETQMLAVADGDDIASWKKIEQPVIATPPPGMKVTGFRDPCPWKEDDGWYLAVGSGERGKGGCVLLYRSHDLRKWEYLHPLVWGKPNGKVAANPCDSGEMWECPDFFPLGKRHCLLYSTENKVIWTTGNYDRQSHTYTPTRSGVLDQGGSYYAPKSFVAPDGRRILWGWLRETRPEAEYMAAGWAGCMSLPRVLTIGAQGQLEMHVAKEVDILRGEVTKASVSADAPFRHKVDDLRCELRLRGVPLIAASVITVRLSSAGKAQWELTIDSKKKQVRCGELEFPFPGLPWPHPDLRMFLDASVVEAFIGAREAITSRVYTLNPGDTTVEVSMQGKGQVALETCALKSISSDRLTN